jgi:hypothetical protein
MKPQQINRQTANLIVFALTCVFAVATGQAQNHFGSRSLLTLTPADARSSDGGGAGDNEKARAAEPARKLQNPVVSLISVPIQINWDFDISPSDAVRYTPNVQPAGDHASRRPCGSRIVPETNAATSWALRI